jgi:hypothetical protein
MIEADDEMTPEERAALEADLDVALRAVSRSG